MGKLRLRRITWKIPTTQVSEANVYYRSKFEVDFCHKHNLDWFDCTSSAIDFIPNWTSKKEVLPIIIRRNCGKLLSSFGKQPNITILQELFT